MTDAELKAWQQLHVRVCTGETLSPEQRAAYEAGKAELDATESIKFDLESLKALRQEVRELEKRRAALQAEYEEVRKKVAVMEQALDEKAREVLGVGIE